MTTTAKTSSAQRAPLSVREYEPLARELLDPVHHDYFAGGAHDEITLRANEAAFARLALVPRILRGRGRPDLTTDLLGRRTSMPIVLAPTAFHRLAHPDAERATARAAASTGAIMIAAMLSTVAVEEIAAEARKTAGDAQLWFQLYVQRDMGFTEALVRRAEDAGCTALVVTADSPALGRHVRNDRNDFHDLPPGMVCENLRSLRADEPGHVRQVDLSPELSWDHVRRLRAMTGLPIVIKGVLHPEDARIAADLGMDAVIVSNHGGRQLDTTPATITQLPRVLDAVGDRIPVLLDGGVRRGTDVAKALALGAAAVAVGRPVVWGLTVGGQQGVEQVLGMLRDELAHTLTLCGCAGPAELDRDMVAREDPRW
ncbi:alpha-hydroxy-acid oxidizing enzyme [Streptomyces griseofuscus]|uniref:alpha-hydroxy acid oxidase n=1 Tax=Streptomyces griseofuscus TaxID=146922 RepID=UPI000F655E08|nr:alpha-hydroxy acid oxidase [Streptomyces griseofuscus]RRQ73517.1 alpha-hydroxy-acid oxidizing enzyme [Streptomyces griseofuscus]